MVASGMIEFQVIFALVVLVAAFVYMRLRRTNAEFPGDAEKRMTPKQALQFALDNNIPLTNSLGRTDGRNLWLTGDASGMRVPGDMIGGRSYPETYTEGPNKGYPKNFY